VGAVGVSAVAGGLRPMAGVVQGGQAGERAYWLLPAGGCPP